MMMQLLQDKGK